MKQSRKVVAGIAAGLALTACGQKTAEQTAAPAPGGVSTVFETMYATIIPKSNLIWEQAGNLYDDDGKLDAKRLTDQQWTDVKDAAVAMGVAAKALAEAKGIKVVPPGGKIQGEGTEGAAGAADVQKWIDASPQGFSEDAAKLVAISDEIAAAASAHDAKKTDDAQGRLTDVCAGCHSRFWYPQQAGK
jgi:hypothetical protein